MGNVSWQGCVELMILGSLPTQTIACIVKAIPVKQYLFLFIFPHWHEHCTLLELCNPGTDREVCNSELEHAGSSDGTVQLSQLSVAKTRYPCS